VSNIIQNLSEITDSRELLEARPHKFTSIFSYGLISILLIALIWSYFGEIDIVTKTNGVVKSNDKTISVLNEVDGKVKEMYFKEGQLVKEGDILYTLDSTDVVLSKTNYEKQLKTLQTDTDNINKFRNSILENKNYFNSNNVDEMKYYNKYLQYRTNNEKLSLTGEQTGLEINQTNENKLISLVGISEQIRDNNDVINGLDMVLRSIKDNKNKFSGEETLYSFEYSDYEYGIKSLENTLEQRKIELQSGKDSYKKAINDHKIEVGNANIDYNNSLLKLQEYKSNYISQIQGNITQARNSLDSESITDNEKNQIQKKIDNLELLSESTDENENKFSDSDSEYYNKFIEYQSNVKQLENNIKSQKSLIANLKKKKEFIIDDYNNKLNATKKTLDSGQVDLSKYKNKSALDIKTKLNEVNNDSEKLQLDLEKAKGTPELDDVNKNLATNEITKYKMDTLVQLDDSTKENEVKIDELKTNIGTLQFNIDKSTVKATIDGVVSVKNDISKGQLLKSGDEILSVIPQDSSQYKVKLYVSNKDIAGMKIDEKVKYHFEALPYKEYGELNGTITDIATDATVDQKSGMSYYLVESEIENKPLFSYKGEQGELKIGMTCEAQVITKQKKILYYLLEKINLKN
jgi:membrane fusion protein, peptide pheromone/bacteriocin exporter